MISFVGITEQNDSHIKYQGSKLIVCKGAAPVMLDNKYLELAYMCIC